MREKFPENPSGHMGFGTHPNSWPLPLKVLTTMIVLMLSLGMVVAAGQITVHDIIPTFQGETTHMLAEPDEGGSRIDTRGDLFTDVVAEKRFTPFYQTDEFVFALKFTHIHIFGMSAIFMVMGIIVCFLDLGVKMRTWLITLPFLGIIIDLLSVWLKLFVHPAFFWLHIPGGLLFGAVFAVDAVLILRQLWSQQTVTAAIDPD